MYEHVVNLPLQEIEGESCVFTLSSLASYTSGKTSSVFVAALPRLTTQFHSRSTSPLLPIDGYPPPNILMEIRLNPCNLNRPIPVEVCFIEERISLQALPITQVKLNLPPIFDQACLKKLRSEDGKPGYTTVEFESKKWPGEIWWKTAANSIREIFDSANLRIDMKGMVRILSELHYRLVSTTQQNTRAQEVVDYVRQIPSSNTPPPSQKNTDSVQLELDL